MRFKKTAKDIVLYFLSQFVENLEGDRPRFAASPRFENFLNAIASLLPYGQIATSGRNAIANKGGVW
ncbi:hypothetical protein AB0756_39895 [Tolypothrix campylonemoides VB511288_2]|uniref:Uncharacterized protein n=3 Tax=Nostocales TaxID=1161 RepID=A0A0C1R517_9CYAN